MNQQIRSKKIARRFSAGVFFTLSACVVSISFPLFPDAVASEAKPAPVVSEDKPYSVDAEGRIDWYTFSGYRRYHSVCHTCHGPAGLGGSFAPSLIDVINQKGLTYERYFEVVVNGIKKVSASGTSNMPSFARDMNVMCFVDDIYAYLIARADGAVGPTRPKNKQPKPEAAKERDESCMGG